MIMFKLLIKCFLKKEQHFIMNNNISSLIKFKGEQSFYPWITNNVISYLKIKKFHSMRETPQLGINYNNIVNLIGFIINVKMFITRGQYACNNIIGLLHQRLNVEHSSVLSSNINKLNLSISAVLAPAPTPTSKRLRSDPLKLKVPAAWPLPPQTNSSEEEFFKQWLVGITDGNGSFSIHSSLALGSTKWNLIYKLSQNTSNLRILHYIKKNIYCGTVTIEKDHNNANFIIRDFETIKKVILPIFDKYPLLTNKAFNYEKFKQAVLILDNPKLTLEQKNIKLVSLNNMDLPINYISSAWIGLTKEDLNSGLVTSIMSKAWLIGFTEAEGSFYLKKKSNSIRPFCQDKTETPNVNITVKEGRESPLSAFSVQSPIVHGFRISKKQEPLCLEAIRIILHIKTKVVLNKNSNYYMLDTTNSRAIENIIKYFSKRLKGMKSVEYRIWARAYLKYKGNGNSMKLQAIEKERLLRVMRKFKLKKEDK